MTIGVVDAHVPYSLMTVLRGVVEVEAEVEAVIHGQRHVVGPFIDITVGTDATEAQVGVREASFRAAVVARCLGHGRYLRGHRHAVSAAHDEGGGEVDLIRHRPLHGDVQLVAVVKLVGKPPVIPPVEAAFVPRQRVGGREVEARGVIMNVGLHAVRHAAPIHHVVVPTVGGRLYSCPRSILQHVACPLIVGFHRQVETARRLGIQARGELPGPHGFKLGGGRHPIVGGQVEERVGYAVHILRHHGVGQLGCHRAAHLPAHGDTRVEAHKSFAVGAEQAGVEARVKAPLRCQAP